jgi:hypothetical protein
MSTHPHIAGELARARQRDLLEEASRVRLSRQLTAAATAAPRRRRVLLVTLAAATAAVALGLTACGASPSGPVPPSPSTAPAPPVTLAGTWNGPVPDPPGNCGAGAGTFQFGPDGSYTFSGMFDPSTDCAGYTSNGSYQLNGDAVIFQPDDENAFTDTYSLDGDNLQLCDSSGSPCYQYQKQ